VLKSKLSKVAKMSTLIAECVKFILIASKIIGTPDAIISMYLAQFFPRSMLTAQTMKNMLVDNPNKIACMFNLYVGNERSLNMLYKAKMNIMINANFNFFGIAVTPSSIDNASDFCSSNDTDWVASSVTGCPQFQQ
jgi:hypothetical protein